MLLCCSLNYNQQLVAPKANKNISGPHSDSLPERAVNVQTWFKLDFDNIYHTQVQTLRKEFKIRCKVFGNVMKITHMYLLNNELKTKTKYEATREITN